MQKAIFAILTNKNVRNARGIQAIRARHCSAGAPWFDRLVLTRE